MTARPIHLCPPLRKEDLTPLHAGDPVRIDGRIYVARDAAHKRMVEAMASGAGLPFDAVGQVIYYMGPSPARPGRPIGSAGPTTSYRMDPYTESMIRAGVRALIGKGPRGPEVKRALRAHGAIYLIAVGGAGALLAQRIRGAELIAYPDLGPEALRMLEVADFPATVGYDTYGEDIYEIGRAPYRHLDAG
jgi:fumarate hydratase subunit beta